MTKGTNKTLSLEILISTMNRSSLSFLEPMFPGQNYLNFHLLIINQTSKDVLLNSDHEHIRVINVFDKGLSKSRNRALYNAKGDICLIADDDLVYRDGFQSRILEAYQMEPAAEAIIFKAEDFDGNDYRSYPLRSSQLDRKSVKGVISWEISFKPAPLRNKGIRFNEYFGLGAEFPTAEEYLFMCDIIEKGSHVYFNDSVVVSHDVYNSGKELGSDQIVYARAGLNYYLYGGLVYFWVLRYLMFLLSNNYIKTNQLYSKFRIAMNGIKKSRSIFKK